MRNKINLKQYTVDRLKDKLNLDHSEELFNIEAEKPYQCPRIDSFLKDLDLIKQHVNRLAEIAKDEDIKDIDNRKLYANRELEVLEKYCDVMKDSYEEIRSACDSLRTRGEDWKKLARNLFNKHPFNIQKGFIDVKFKDKI